MINHYQGNTGRVQRIPDPDPVKREVKMMQTNQKPPPEKSGGGLNRSVQRIMRRFSPEYMQQEDILLMLILYLLYRESGNREFLITLGAFMLL